MFSFDFLTLPQNVWQEWAGIILLVRFSQESAKKF